MTCQRFEIVIKRSELANHEHSITASSLVMKDIKINGNTHLGSVVYFDNAEISISNIDENIQVYGEGNQISVVSNMSNLNIYGDGNKIDIKGNESNLHIYGDYNVLNIRDNQRNLHVYGDHLRVNVEKNDSNLHIQGGHNNVVVLCGRAIVYGSYGSVTIHEKAKVDFYGDYKKINKLS
jgi:hypothetical protein